MTLNFSDSDTSKTFDATYKMLVLDLDDTLLRDDYSISARNKELLIRAQKQGVKVVLASGRPTPAMLRYAEELNLAHYDSYMISFNGAIVTSMKDNNIIFETSLTNRKFTACMISASKTTYILSLIPIKELLAKQIRNISTWN